MSTTKLIEIHHNNFLYSPFYIEVLVPDNLDTELYVKGVLEKEIMDFEEECLYWGVNAECSHSKLLKKYHRISVSTPNNKLVIWLPKEELSYETFNEYIAEALNLVFYTWNKYEDLYIQLPLDFVVVKSNDAEELFKTGRGYGSFLIRDKTTNESCWLDVAFDKDEVTWDFNQYIFSVTNKEDIQARYFQDRIVSNGDCDIGYIIEEYIEKQKSLGEKIYGN